MFKKINLICLIVFSLMFLMPRVNADAYWRFQNYQSDGEELIFTSDDSTWTPSVVYYYENDTLVEGVGELNLIAGYFESTGNKNFNVNIKGYEFDSEKTYTIKYTTANGFNASYSYSGEDLNNGAIGISPMPTYGTTIVQVLDGETPVPYGIYNCDGAVGECNDDTIVARFATVNIVFNHYDPSQYSGGGEGEEYQGIPYHEELTEDDEKALDAIFSKITKTGTINVDTINPYKTKTKEELMDSPISIALYKKYGDLVEELYADAEENGNGTLQLTIFRSDDEIGYMVGKTYEVKYIFRDLNKTTLTNINKILDKLSFERSDFQKDYNKRFIIDDLNSVNYYYNYTKSNNEMRMMLSLPNYSSGIREYVSNANIDFMFDPRAGGSESMFQELILGPINILYNGIVYGNVDPIGFQRTNIIYVPSDTQKTDEAFIKAAKKRISEYLKGVKFEIEAVGTLDELDEVDLVWDKYEDDEWTAEPLFDESKTTGSYYVLTFDDSEEFFLYYIVADSTGMKTPSVKTVDINTNIYITTDSFETPLDSNIQATKLDENGEEYKELAKKLNIVKGMAYDLNLYSNSLDMYVSKLEDGSFKVYIPVDEATAKKNLVAVYVKDDGTIEKHPVKIEGKYYAVFETNHFSTYSIVEDTKNPKTVDNIYIYIVILIVGLIGFVSGALYLKKKNKKGIK